MIPGIIRLPIAQLGDNDFQKYGFQKDRAKDGRFWYERKEALKSSEEDQESETPPEESRLCRDKNLSKPPVEIRLSEISAFQPLIAAYEKTLASKRAKNRSRLEQARRQD